MNKEDSAHFRVKCGACQTEWVDAYGGYFTCPECDSESKQQYTAGYVSLQGPHSIVRQVFPGDDDWPY